MSATPTPIESLMTAPRPLLADGGFETWLFFQQGFEAPEFAAIALMKDEAARKAARRYFDEFLAMAEAAGVGFVLDTNSWRGCVSWAQALGMSEKELLDLSADAIAFASDIRDAWSGRVSPIVLNGVIGPAGDGYDASGAPNAERAEALHTPQVEILVQGGADVISAITMTNSAEAIGVARAARKACAPSVISFTVETDGRLPTGETLGEAIARTDSATDGAPLYYMVNCAHPDHFTDALRRGEGWIERIGGVRANASRMSHEELDGSETLDQGDPAEFGALHKELARILPRLKVVGGCCGTDHRHIECVSQHLHRRRAA